ncbi:hypothetical protein ACX8Z9_14475 [Arthrobacter halodurans]|uniref:Uncharacterized protein n=1 Tax=Arthrobacter halodurans TaxID=516699 RepID=A0ABV4UKV5_9MICC
MIQPFTNQVSCGTRKDFYRIFSPNGTKTCFANSGKVAIGGNLSASVLCPGANRGQIYYLYQSKYYYSTLRGPFPVGSYDTCFDFGTTVIAKRVHIV